MTKLKIDTEIDITKNVGRTTTKGWGLEFLLVHDKRYCGKLLVFDKKENKFSMHFHADKIETWYVLQGSFKLRKINTLDAKPWIQILNPGDIVHNNIYEPHQLEALKDNSIILEVSTEDSEIDNYRVEPGDSQKDD